MKRFESVRWFSLDSGNHQAVPSVAGCMLRIALVKVTVAFAGIGRTLWWMRHRIAKIPAIDEVNEEFMEALEYSVAMAAALFPGRAKCLERSLTLFYLARVRGIPVTYHHGVQSSPFKAHAWIELHGRIVNDFPEFIGMFARLPQVCP